MSDAFYIGKRDGTAARNIRDKGMPVTLRSKAGEVFDPNTGTTTGGAVTDVATRALLKSYKLGDVDGQLILRDDVLAIMMAVSDAGAPLSPQPEMQLIANGTTYTIIHVRPVAPGGVAVLYYVQLRG